MGEERYIPPPPAPRKGEFAILEEIPSGIAIALWQELRHVREWATAPEFVRAGLFHPRPSAKVSRLRMQTLQVAGDLAEALCTFWSLQTHPVDVDRAAVAAACRQVAEWAYGNGYVETAIEWAEVGSLCDAENPAAANLAGRITRDAGAYDRAEIWFRRAIGHAREHGLEVELVRAHLGYGKLCRDTGQTTATTRHFHTGSRLAKKSGLQWLAAEVQHDLMLLLTVTGRYAEAGKHASLAFQWYGKRHARLPFFAADLALLFVLQGRHSWAARCAKAAFKHIRQPGARAVLLALRARAFAGTGSIEAFDYLRRRTLLVLERHRDREPEALWHLASAEWMVSRWEEGITTARRSIDAAVARGDREVAEASAYLLTQLEARTAPPGRDTSWGDELSPMFLRAVISRLSIWLPGRVGHSARRAEWAA